MIHLPTRLVRICRELRPTHHGLDGGLAQGQHRGLHRGRGRRGGGRHQDRLVESVGGAGGGVEAGRRGLLVSLGGRQLAGRGGLHSSSDDRPG